MSGDDMRISGETAFERELRDSLRDPEFRESFTRELERIRAVDTAGAVTMWEWVPVEHGWIA